MAKLEELKQWLEDLVVDELKDAVKNGVSIGPRILSLRRGLPTLRTILELRNQKRAMEADSLQIIELLETKFVGEAHLEKEPIRCEPKNWWSVCVLSACTEWQREMYHKSPDIQLFSERSYNQARDELRESLKTKRKAVIPAIAHQLLPARKQAATAHWGPLLAVAGKGSKRLRQIVELGKPLGLFDLVPCWMMNPNTASRLFPLEESYFDMVIFDEASQCPIEQAIPAIYRSKRIVVAGDEKQLPPTSFFHSSLDWEETEAEMEEAFGSAEELSSDELMEKRMKELGKEFAEGVEDLLRASTNLLPRSPLEIHYRSRWPELIEFSNHAFYQGRLQAPPATRVDASAVGPPIVFRHLASAIYDKKTNRHEAREIIKILEEIFKRPGTLPSIGIVTFNQPQCDLIEKLLDEHADQNEDFGAKYYQARQMKSGDQDVGLFVKNLETVQGDEREVMIFSTTFGRKKDGTFHRYFGPINFDGGERRLNVAITRSQAKKIIVSSMPVHEISARALTDNLDPGEAYSGRDYLQLYILYAQAVSEGKSDQARAMLAQAGKIGQVEGLATGTGVPETEFEAEVKESLERRFIENGWDNLVVDSQIGSVGFRIDLAVRRNDSSGYLLGIECDGKTYHSSPSARFRDIWRQDILERYGWQIHRIWSQNWWTQPDYEINKVIRRLKQML